MAAARSTLAVLVLLALLAGARAARTDPAPAASPDPLALLDPGLSPEERALARFLAHLGWRFEVASDATAIAAETPTLPALDSPGDLRVRIPRSPTPEQVSAFAASLPSLADSVASRLAWQRMVAAATERATRRLSESSDCGRYVFPKFFIVFDSPFFEVSPPSPEWRRHGSLWRAVGSSRKAVEAFYRKPAVAECYTAQILATFAVQYELHGPENFEDAFRPDHLALGQPADYHATEYGQYLRPGRRAPWKALVIPESEQSRDPISVLSRYGPLPFVGLTGIVRDPKGSDACNENFTLVSISRSAIDALLSGGGLVTIPRLTAQARDHHRATRKLFATAPVIREHRREMDSILTSPLFQDTRLYIHPYGVISLGEIARKKILHDEIGVELAFYLHGREDAFFRLYRDSFLRRSLPSLSPPSPPSPPSPAPPPLSR